MTRRAPGVVVALLVLCGAAAADGLSKEERARLEQEVEQLNVEGARLYQQGKLREAVGKLSRVLEITGRLYPEADYPRGHPRLAAGLKNLGFLLAEMGEPEKALPYYRRALDMDEKLYPEKEFPRGHPVLAQSIHNLGFLLAQMKQAERALPLFERALAMRERLYPRGHPSVAASLDSMGSLLESLGRHDKALPYHERALALKERLYPAEEFPRGHPDLAQSLYNLGNVLATLQQRERALTFHERALAMRERLYPQGHPDVGISLNNLGALLQEMGELARARVYFERDVALCERYAPEKDFPRGQADLAGSLNNLGSLLEKMGDAGGALPVYERALAVRRRLYPEKEYPRGHPDLATSLHNLGNLLVELGEYRRAQALLRDALAMWERLYPEKEHPRGQADLATTLNALGVLLHRKGETAEALRCQERALAMRERLYPEREYPQGHEDVATSLNNVGAVLIDLGQHDKALPFYERALAMRERLYPAKAFPRGHARIAGSLNNLGYLLKSAGERTKALPYFERALAMTQRLYPAAEYPAGHPSTAVALNNLGTLLGEMGRQAEALSYFEQALTMRRRLYPEKDYPRGHRLLAASLDNLGFTLDAAGRPREALSRHQEALAMYERLYPAKEYPRGHPDLALCLDLLGRVEARLEDRTKALEHFERALAMRQAIADAYAAGAGSAEAAAFESSLPAARSACLSASHERPETDAEVYQHLWASRSSLTRVFEARHEAARLAVARSPQARAIGAELADVRRALHALLLMPADPSPASQAERDRRLRDLTDRRDHLERDLVPFLPEIERRRELARLGPADLARKLPADAAFIDFFRYLLSFRMDHPPETHYAAFVVVPGRPVRRVELGEARAIDEAIVSWRRAIDRREDSAAPAALRRLVWDRLAACLPGGTRTVYLAPDSGLACIPFAALPGAAAGTALLEEFAGGIAVVPHGPFLLDQLLFPRHFEGDDRVLAVGAVRYDLRDTAAEKPWPFLPGTEMELKRIGDLAGGRPLTALAGHDAGSAAVLEALPRARCAHLATHGLFEEEALRAERARARGQWDRWQYVAGQRTEQVGVGGRSPLGYVGMVLAGANLGERAGKDGGILSGEAIVDLPLEDLRLCVLSACETGLGDLAGGEGVSGLQHAFHLAGCPNVVASLWKVDDAATAALMTVFYRELWEKGRPPLEALREAQLTVYRHPERIPVLAGERGRPALEAAAKLGSAAEPPKPGVKPNTSPPRLWAAFVLSGVGASGQP